MKLPPKNLQHGFTLVELIIVMSLIAILAAIAVPIYRQSLVHSKESTLKEELYTLRKAIDDFTLDKNRAPQALDDLVAAGYIHSIPKDPFTGSDSTWQVENEDVLLTIDQQDPGISDVHSGAGLTATDGTAYSTW